MAYKNSEDSRRYNRDWFRDNPEKRRGYEKKWREKNPEKVRMQKGRYYEKNKEYIKNKSKEYYDYVRMIYLREHVDSERIKNREKSQKKAQAKRDLLHNLRMSLGGKCARCGYCEEINILQFHHHNKDKINNVTELQSLKKIKEEAEKCTLLCPNCHSIIHLKKYVHIP